MNLPKFKLKSILALVLISTALFTSCKDKDQVTEIETNATQEATLEQKKQALDNYTPNSNTTTNSSDNLAVNPAHGMPGHSCEIPVGAPLTNAGAAKVAPVKVEMNKTNTTPTTSTGLNPAHGQPGHRCDIQVGAPL